MIFEEDERKKFEEWYVADAKAQGVKVTITEMENMRNGDHYGEHRHMLNGKWFGWRARAMREVRQ